MAKKKGDDLIFGVDHSFNNPDRRGRSAKKPQGLPACMDEFIKMSRTWKNRHKEVWFDEVIKPLESADGATSHGDAPSWYDDAIRLIEEIARLAAEGKEKLEKGKAEAEGKLAGKKAEQAPRPVDGASSSEGESTLENYFTDAF